MTAEIYPDVPGGVIMVDGYGIRINVERGHLIVSDGFGRTRRQRRIPRVGHDLRRLIIIGHTGTISLDAMRWLDRAGIHFTQLDSDGQLLIASANPRLDNARLRRAQQLAYDTEDGIVIARYIIDTKLIGQANIARDYFTSEVADRIEDHRRQLDSVNSITDVIKLEAKAAKEYFAAWNDHVTISWATRHHHRVPEHWHQFRARRSPITLAGSSRAANPINAILNYLYALAEVECRYACLALGLDPGLGYLHADIPQRDSLALDFIETIRPDVDKYVLDFLQHHLFKSDDFAEQEDGHCRITPPLSHRLGATLLDWRIALAHHAEHIGGCIASATDRPVAISATLTRAIPRIRYSTNMTSETRIRRQHPRPCQDCGVPLATTARLYCPNCLPARRVTQQHKAISVSAASLIDQASRQERGRQISEGKHAAKIAAAPDYGYDISDWEKVEHDVRQLTLKQIMNATGLAITQASKIKSGRTLPHPRHWAPLVLAVS